MTNIPGHDGNVSDELARGVADMQARVEAARVAVGGIGADVIGAVGNGAEVRGRFTRIVNGHLFAIADETGHERVVQYTTVRAAL